MEGSQTRNAQSRQPVLSVVMPVFREAAHLPATLAAVRNSLNECNLPYELMLVDDGSPDDTWRIIAAEAKAFQAVRALRLSRNFGKESALSAGLEHAGRRRDRDGRRRATPTVACSEHGTRVADLWS